MLGPQATAQEVTRKLAEMWAHISVQERELLQEEVDRERARWDLSCQAQMLKFGCSLVYLKPSPDAKVRM